MRCSVIESEKGGAAMKGGADAAAAAVAPLISARQPQAVRDTASQVSAFLDAYTGSWNGVPAPE